MPKYQLAKSLYFPEYGSEQSPTTTRTPLTGRLRVRKKFKKDSTLQQVMEQLL